MIHLKLENNNSDNSNSSSKSKKHYLQLSFFPVFLSSPDAHIGLLTGPLKHSHVPIFQQIKMQSRKHLNM